MTKSLIATLFAASLFSSAAMANTSADTAPSRLPAATSASSARAVPSAAESAALASRVWEGGQAAAPARPVVQRQPMARAGSPAMLMASSGAPYDNGAAN